ncbi:MAG: ATP-binding protein, partial [Oscillibacter sp.]|nr:ATP-binding protein [Oscillibacter sp.]
ERTVARYVEKISGPLLDRIDLHVRVPSVEYEAMRRREAAEDSATVKARVDAAREVQRKRFADCDISCNAHIPPSNLAQYCTLNATAEVLMENAFRTMGLTARSHDRILRVARTIADLDGAEEIQAPHLAEAIQYRNTELLKS